MKEHQTDILNPAYDAMFDVDFIHKGQTGVYWKNDLSAEEVARYEAYAVHRMGRDAARFMMTGEWSHGKEEL